MFWGKILEAQKMSGKNSENPKNGSIKFSVGKKMMGFEMKMRMI